eukprot:6205544-Pleurochrysis_carterae.AAC.3
MANAREKRRLCIAYVQQVWDCSAGSNEGGHFTKRGLFCKSPRHTSEVHTSEVECARPLRQSALREDERRDQEEAVEQKPGEELRQQTARVHGQMDAASADVAYFFRELEQGGGEGEVGRAQLFTSHRLGRGCGNIGCSHLASKHWLRRKSERGCMGVFVWVREATCGCIRRCAHEHSSMREVEQGKVGRCIVC